MYGYTPVKYLLHRMCRAIGIYDCIIGNQRKTYAHQLGPDKAVLR